ncbi:hypothetical protein BGW36DRAFT_431722 [Talaromyces proteolyticus]|uniref:HNH nuclease domain-containing protein n=1 Tax=Talaromyces proteolyticus TaxID=1131652 RepID=A0AAD4PVT7_9EURO|nr:uncharacterized protein BGW36DRAFT_431722 [Talaromyces proteolyticus]KAH8691162.1 hypothetical protein BGW36DRAFT_431722 [Talaromyces proteolyticus]
MLIRDHHAKDPYEQGLWCNVLGEYLEPSTIEPFDFFPHLLREEIMQKFFGSSSANELYSPRNGLLMNRRIEKHFCEFSIVIVPINDPMTHRRWKTMVLNKRLLNEQISEGSSETFKIIHDKELTFKGKARPAARYAYFHYMVAMMKIAATTELGILSSDYQTNCWDEPTFRRYLVFDSLSKLTEEIGKCTLSELPEIRKRFFGQSAWETGNEETTAKLVVDALNKRMQG